MGNDAIKTVEHQGLSLQVDLHKVVSFRFTELLSKVQDDDAATFDRLTAGVRAFRYLFGKQVDDVIDLLGEDASVDDVIGFLTDVLGKASKN